MSWFMPSRIMSGPGAVAQSAAVFKALLLDLETRPGGREKRPRALIVSGRHSARVSGALDDILALLDQSSCEREIFDKVEPNPLPQTAIAGARLAKDYRPDLVLGIGGGSALDAAKAIALFAVNEVPLEESLNPRLKRDALPLVAVPTTAGTGSEVTPYAILTDTARRTKTSISHASLFPRLALLDGRYTESQDRQGLVHCALDAFSHALEGCLTKRRTPFSRAVAHSTLGTLCKLLHALAKGGSGKTAGQALDAKDRQELLEASTMAGMVIAQSGTTVGHAMGYCLTVDRGVDHGRANALVLPDLLSLLEKIIPEEIRVILSACSLASTGELRQLFDSLLGSRETATEAELSDWAARAAGSKNLANMIYAPSRDELEAILRASLTGAQS